MGFLNIFKKGKEKHCNDSVLMGYLRVEAGNLLGLDPNTREYDKACESAINKFEPLILPILDKNTQREVVSTLRSVSKDRSQELYGQYLTLLFVRIIVIEQAIAHGTVTREEATPNIVANALFDQVKDFINKNLG